MTLIILLSCLHQYMHIHSINFNEYKLYIKSHVQKPLEVIKKNSLYITAIPLLLYHHENITNFITYRPYISSFCFYFLLNYTCDSILDYQKQKEIYAIIYKLKKICLYLAIAHGIKNHIHQKNIFLHHNNNEQKFINAITETLPYSFEETTLMSIKLYQELKNYLQSLNTSLTIESEEFVFLCHASSIKIQTLLYLTQNSPDLHQALYKFEKNPDDNIDALTQYLKLEITQSLLDFEKYLYQSHKFHLQV